MAPINVPKIVPTPPNTEVPPTKTDARVLNRYPSPSDGQRYVTSRLAGIPDSEGKKPICIKMIVFTLPSDKDLEKKGLIYRDKCFSKPLAAYID